MERLGDTSPAAVHPPPQGVAGGGAFVLLIGEDEVVRDSLAALLQAHGFGVLAASRPGDLPPAPAGLSPLCAVLDPDREGAAEAAVIAEARQCFPDLPLIAITHSLAPAGREAALPEGVERLRKPLQPECLLGRLAALREARAATSGISRKDHSG